MEQEDQIKALAKLREPFKEHQIGKLPKPTKAQTDEVKADYKKGIRCNLCGTWHHPKVVHLDYVGHAALTDRLLDVDPFWFWEPLAFNPEGLPKLDAFGGLWIRLTICGMSRLGYGHSEGKTGGDATKEAIGDALRNAAMRFGAALDLWHKGDLHGPEEPDQKPEAQPTAQPDAPAKGPYAFPWSIDDLDEFEATKDRAYAAFKAAGKTVDDYNTFAETWKERQQTDPPEKVLTGFADIVNKLEAATKKEEKAA